MLHELDFSDFNTVIGIWQSSACLTTSDFAVWQRCCKSFCTPAFAV